MAMVNLSMPASTSICSSMQSSWSPSHSSLIVMVPASSIRYTFISSDERPEMSGASKVSDWACTPMTASCSQASETVNGMWRKEPSVCFASLSSLPRLPTTPPVALSSRTSIIFTISLLLSPSGLRPRPSTILPPLPRIVTAGARSSAPPNSYISPSSAASSSVSPSWANTGAASSIAAPKSAASARAVRRVGAMMAGLVVTIRRWVRWK
mmetsp:Transcript_10907/g.25876  ORF Transcript_10907/g.25876 Transcript_10907/m.25876 type:complete len:210 (+) Transcript_10907:628-1257(+)